MIPNLGLIRVKFVVAGYRWSYLLHEGHSSLDGGRPLRQSLDWQAVDMMVCDAAASARAPIKFKVKEAWVRNNNLKLIVQTMIALNHIFAFVSHLEP